jgi:hypothetical protein
MKSCGRKCVSGRKVTKCIAADKRISTGTRQDGGNVMAKSYETPLRLRMPGGEEFTNDPNKWFADKFPEQVVQYGAAFMEGTWTDADGLTRLIPVHMNDDFFAVALGGDKSSGHQVVWFPQEETFYFFDYRVDAFCPTTEEKLKLLLSNYLIRCSQDCGCLVDISNLVVKFRQDHSHPIAEKKGLA